MEAIVIGVLPQTLPPAMVLAKNAVNPDKI
jgi:hypothetical protein